MFWWLRKQLLRLKLYAYENYQYEAESLVIWYAVCYALGVAFYFIVPWELPIWLIVIYLEAVLLLLYLYRQKNGYFKILSYLAVFMLGLCIAKGDALYKKTKLEDDLNEINYLNGYIEDLDYNHNQKPRLHLIQVNNFEKELKGTYNITLNYQPEWLKKGICVEMVAKFPKDWAENPLSHYNYRRVQFYQGISASGYAISPLFETECATQINNNRIKTIQQNIKNIIEKNTTTEEGNIIKALSIGDKTTLNKNQVSAYRTSGLAHLLAISGMHMGMITLLVFFLVRLLMLPIGFGQYDTRKPAALIALCLSGLYFMISGQSISCLRAFIMISIILLAILLNRRSFSLRIWAFALLIVTSINPSAVVTPGFLMSFSATLGIAAFYEKYAESLRNWYKTRSLSGKIGTYLLGVIITDLIASLMTLPYTIYYFHQISVYTTLGNLLAAPIMAFWVMPMLLLFLLSIPLGIAEYVIKPLSSGVYVLNQIAEKVSALAGAHSGEGIDIMPEWGILAITFGMLWLCIWQERWRLLGIGMIVVGFMSLWTIPQVDFVFDAGGQTFACRTADNKLSVTPWHKNRFLSNTWTENNNNAQGLDCNKTECTCQNDIKFSKGKVWWKKNAVNLNYSGFIDKEKGIFYKYASPKRIWDK